MKWLTVASWVVLSVECIAAGADVPATRPAPATRLAPVTRPASATRPAPGAADRIAAESLRRTARDMLLIEKAPPWRAGRLVALVRMADRLVPDDPKTQRLLADIHQIQGAFDKAAASLRICLDAAPRDYALGLQWLEMELSARERNVEQRIKFLEGVRDDSRRTKPLRAEAATQLGRILLRRGDKAEARKAVAAALELDPLSPGALAVEVALDGASDPVKRIKAQAALWKAEPRSWQAAQGLALSLNQVGAYVDALGLLEFANTLAVQTSADRGVIYELVIQRLNTLLNLGASVDKKSYALAVDQFRRAPDLFPDSVDLKALLKEAYDGAGNPEGAEKIGRALEIEIGKKRHMRDTDGALALEIAWFYVRTRPRPGLALEFAKKAAAARPDDAVAQRVLAVAKLKSVDDKLVAEGERKLKEFLADDAYAVAVLAEHYFTRSQLESGRKTLAVGITPAGRGGPAFRRIRKLAEKYDVPIPESEAHKAVKSKLTSLAPYRDIGLTPERYLAAKITAVRTDVPPGEPIEMELTLTNISGVKRDDGADVKPLPVALGPGGLCKAVMSVETKLLGDPPVLLRGFPLVALPAPRYLRPGETVSTRFRLDVGPLGVYLAAHPLRATTLHVFGLLDPVQTIREGRAFRSKIPTVQVQPVGVRQMDMIFAYPAIERGDDWAKAYKLMLAHVVRDIRKGDLATRCKAARRVGSLLALARGLERNTIQMPAKLREAVDKLLLLSMLRAVLQDRSPAVRAEMVAALGVVPMDAWIPQLLAKIYQDPSPVVRFRLVELIGASDVPARKKIVARFANDPDPLVREMVAAYGKAK